MKSHVVIWRRGVLSCLTFWDAGVCPCGGAVWAALCGVCVVQVCEFWASLVLSWRLHRFATLYK